MAWSGFSFRRPEGRAQHRPVRGLALTVALAVSLPIVTVTTPMQAAQAAAIFKVQEGCKDNDTQGESTSSNKCFNGTWLRSRSGLSPDCTDYDVADPRHVYPRAACGGSMTRNNLEFIAQARLIRSLSRKLGYPAGGVHPNIQWEGALREGKSAPRTDVLTYDSSLLPSAAAVIKVIEVKGRWNGGWTTRQGQAQGYVDRLRDLYGMTGGVLESSDEFMKYTDHFLVEVDRCADKARTPVVVTVDAEVTVAGVVDLHRGAPSACPPNAADQPSEDPDRDPLPRTPSDDPENEYEGRRPPTNTSLKPPTVSLDDPSGRSPARSKANIRRLWLLDPDEACNAFLFQRTPQGNVPLTSVPAVYQACRAATTFSDALDAIEAAEGLVGLCRFYDCLSDDTLGGGAEDAQAGGDPHITTLDGLNYELQSVGEFTLARSRKLGLDVQTRFTGSGPNVSVISAVTSALNGFLVEVDMQGRLMIDGEAVDATAPGLVDLGLGAYVAWQDGRFVLVGPAAQEYERPALSWTARGTSANISLSVPRGLTDDLVGLVGDGDGNTDNDLRLSDGTPVPAVPSAEYLHGAFADSWRVTPGISMFTYAAGQSTATFTDRAFPARLVSVGDFSEQEQSDAIMVCQNNAVPAGPGFDDCVLDVLVTADARFAVAARDSLRPSVVAGDRTVDGGGLLTEDFEAAVPGNLRALRVGQVSGESRFAGPLGGTEQYRFYVPELPDHGRATVQFDLLTLGAAWTAGEYVTLNVNDVQHRVEPVNGATVTRVLPDGVVLRRTPVRLELDHHQPQLTATLASVGIAATENKAFALDRLNVQLLLTPAQVFPVSLVPGEYGHLGPALGAGAGVLETRGSKDVFAFALPAASELRVFKGVPSTLTDSSGRHVPPTREEYGSVFYYGLDGAYTLTVAGTEYFVPAEGLAYDLQVALVPEPDEFLINLPGPVVVRHGQPGPGAGYLESELARDVYRFYVDGPDRAIRFTPEGCPSRSPFYGKGRYDLLDAQGTLIASGTCSEGSKRIGGLDEGFHRLVFMPENGVDGLYGFSLSQEGPAAYILSGPAQFSSATDLRFELGTGATGPTTYECALDPQTDAGPFLPCATGHTYRAVTEGAHIFHVRALDALGNRGPNVQARYVVDRSAPSVTLTRTPAPLSGPTATFRYTASEEVTYECSLLLNGSIATGSSCASTGTTYTALQQGAYVFRLTGRDEAGNTGTTEHPFRVDTTAPSVPVALTAKPVVGTVNADSASPAKGVPVRLQWTASTDNQAVTGYDILQSVNGGAFIKLQRVTGTAPTLYVAPGTNTVSYRVSAVDGAGNASAPSAATPATVVGLDQESAPAVTYTGTWSADTVAGASGGTLRSTSTANTSASYTAPAGTRAAAVVFATGPNMGRVSVAVDGGTPTVVSLYAATAGQRQVKSVIDGLAATMPHTIVVRALGTKVAESSGIKVSLDAFIRLS